jgi:hypothetical protein
MASVRLLRLPPGQPARPVSPHETAYRRDRDREVAEYIVFKGREQVSPAEAAEGVSKMNLAELVLIEIEMRERRSVLHQVEYRPYG